MDSEVGRYSVILHEPTNYLHSRVEVISLADAPLRSSVIDTPLFLLPQPLHARRHDFGSLLQCWRSARASASLRKNALHKFSIVKFVQ